MKYPTNQKNFAWRTAITFESDLIFFLDYLKYPGLVSKNKSYRFWESWTRPLGPRTMQMMGVRILTNWNRKITSPKWSRIVLRHSGDSFQNIYNKNGPPDRLEPHIAFFLDFVVSSIGVQRFITNSQYELLMNELILHVRFWICWILPKLCYNASGLLKLSFRSFFVGQKRLNKGKTNRTNLQFVCIC